MLIVQRYSVLLLTFPPYFVLSLTLIDRVKMIFRCEVEITGLRKKNHDLESAMRELQVILIAKSLINCKKTT